MGFNRREFLRGTMGAVAIAAAAAVGADYFLDIKAREEETQARIDQTLRGAPGTPEIMPKGAFVPEDERDGTDIMIGIGPALSLSPFKQFDFARDFSEDSPTNAILKSLPRETRVHGALPKEAISGYLAFAREKYPHLEFHVYESPVSYSGLTFMQDIVCTAGSQSEEGQFNIAVSSLEPDYFRGLVDFHRERLSQAAWWQKIGAKGDELEAGYKLLADDWLAGDYPETFRAVKMPLSLVGGDLRPIRLPDGRSAVILGQGNFVTAVNFISELNVGPNPVFSYEELQDLVTQVKEAYKKYLNVDEVIILDEKHLLELAEEEGLLDLRKWKNPDFFHADMMVACATGAKDVPYAFVSEYPWKNNRVSMAYSGRIKQQFADLGYKVLPLEVGRYPTMNYTNVIFLKDSNGQKTVILPQYGDRDKDAAAVRMYEAAGFKVITTDFSFIGGEAFEGHEATTGSARCSMTVLK